MIHMTMYDPSTKKCTAPSEDSGFKTLDEVKVLMGEPTHTKPAILLYEQAEDKGVVFSKLPFKMKESDDEQA